MDRTISRSHIPPHVQARAVRAAPERPNVTSTVPLPPREVWPLLETIATTMLVMAGFILWHAVPALASGLGIGLVTGGITMAAAIGMIRLVTRIATPIRPVETTKSQPA